MRKRPGRSYISSCGAISREAVPRPLPRRCRSMLPPVLKFTLTTIIMKHSHPNPHHPAHQKHPAHRTHRHDHSRGASHGRGHGSGNKLFAVLHHAGGELFDMGGYLIFGAAVAAAAQAFLPRAELAGNRRKSGTRYGT
ncbi:hypothetical protein SAMN02799624_02131 [Paenibacillus sp. UNC496MF]|uniref:hypothetical protein n=1 Tax=Paenibacillus sp. UNC496MF TaxID=1502753 RepID=UPI0008F245C1|nr:hypothetical protein [Paenibacillus sp. UNC496MF]SFI77659.1 hypothetical protein SAMN02799624_02131 [Paenibacillus sp. UNC496MF]